MTDAQGARRFTEPSFPAAKSIRWDCRSSPGPSSKKLASRTCWHRQPQLTNVNIRSDQLLPCARYLSKGRHTHSLRVAITHPELHEDTLHSLRAPCSVDLWHWQDLLTFSGFKRNPASDKKKQSTGPFVASRTWTTSPAASCATCPRPAEPKSSKRLLTDLRPGWASGPLANPVTSQGENSHSKPSSLL